MNEFSTQWSRDDLKAYILLYCANADFVETEEETSYIKSKISDHGFENIHDEFIGDNDYQGLQKIRSTLDRFKFTKDEVAVLLSEIKELFLSDGSFDTLERNLFMRLNQFLE